MKGILPAKKSNAATVFSKAASLKLSSLRASPRSASPIAKTLELFDPEPLYLTYS